MPADSTPGTTLVLASGGIDSSALMGLLHAQQAPTEALFVDYGQGPAEAERAAVSAVCGRLTVPVRFVRYSGSQFGRGEIRGRNAFLLHTALLEFNASHGTILIGIHAGTGYRDCTPEFLDLMQRSFEFHTGGAISLSAPFVDWSKSAVVSLAVDLGIPLSQTHSCEVASTPCGVCRSCLDRRAVDLP